MLKHGLINDVIMLEVPKHITMCFHNSMSKKAKQLATRYGRQLNIVEIAEKIIQEQYHVSAFKNPKYPIITADPNIQIFNWWLIPFWVKSREEADTIRTKTYNARSETIFQKPSFRSSIINQRCIVPSTGFFDWRHENGEKRTEIRQDSGQAVPTGIEYPFRAGF